MNGNKRGLLEELSASKIPRLTADELRCTNKLDYGIVDDVFCNSLELDPYMLQSFNCKVCTNCRYKWPERYGLISKSDVLSNYLLVDADLNRSDIKCVTKENPIEKRFNPMKLYLLCQIEILSTKKWGSEANLKLEKEKREKLKFEKQLNQIEAQLNNAIESNFALGANNIKSTNARKTNSINSNNSSSISTRNKQISKKTLVRNKFLIDAIQTVQSSQV